MAAPGTKVGLLNSWKEIAMYLGRGVRTAQRWEQFGLPVRRVAPGPRASVIAHANEIDQWMSRGQSRPAGTVTHAKRENFDRELFDAISHGRQLQQKMAQLRETGKFRVQELRANITRLEQSFARTKKLASQARERGHSPVR
jgi:hypothetical protein